MTPEATYVDRVTDGAGRRVDYLGEIGLYSFQWARLEKRLLKPSFWLCREVTARETVVNPVHIEAREG